MRTYFRIGERFLLRFATEQPTVSSPPPTPEGQPQSEPETQQKPSPTPNKPRENSSKFATFLLRIVEFFQKLRGTRGRASAAATNSVKDLQQRVETTDRNDTKRLDELYDRARGTIESAGTKPSAAASKPKPVPKPKPTPKPQAPLNIQNHQAETKVSSMQSKGENTDIPDRRKPENLSTIPQNTINKTGAKPQAVPSTPTQAPETRLARNPEVPEHIMQEMQQRKQELESKFTTLSDEQYQTMFGGEIFQHPSSAICYALAAINSIKHSLHCKTLIITSVKKTENGYVVMMPLGDRTKNVKPVTLTKQEVHSVQTVQINGQPFQIHPASGGLGWVVLEAAIIKYMHGSVDRAKSSFGMGHKALQCFLGPAVKEDALVRDWKHPFASKPQQRMEAEAWLNRFSPQSTIATVNTCTIPQTPTALQGFHPNHAYSLLRTDPARREVVIADPMNTSVEITVDYDRFLRAFGSISAVRIDFSKLYQPSSSHA